MYYKLYRRRHTIYFIGIVIVLCLFIFDRYDRKTKSSSYDANIPLEINNGAVNVKNNNQIQRINIENYVPPPPCSSCPGEMGRPVSLTADERKIAEEEFKTDFYYNIASEKVSLWRTLPDYRNSECKEVQYPRDLPTASVVVVFKNERWSPLLRTVYSILHNTPKHLLKEIVLVDDQSELEELKQKLQDYCDEHFGDIVKLYRAPKRLGLIAGKNYGGRLAQGEVIIFLDAHCEATTGWIEPILARIKEKPSAVVVPTIGGIDPRNLAFGASDGWSYGIFSWSLFFFWGQMPDRIRKARKKFSDAYPSATMPGGLIGANKDFFFKTGGFDDGMEVWGGENLEISFRTWMCGGSIEFIPCSHVGHIFRPGHPYNMTGEKAKDDVHGRNSVRLAEAFMDDYKRLYYMHRTQMKFIDYGDISSRLQIRKDLNCKSFKWYLDNVLPEKFILDENVYAFGEVRNEYTSLCLDTLGAHEDGHLQVGVYGCQSGSFNQVFSLSHKNELRREDVCCYVSNDGQSSKLSARNCDDSEDQKWSHTSNGNIVHKKTGLCIDASGLKNGDFAKLTNCDKEKNEQLWKFGKYY